MYRLLRIGLTLLALQTVLISGGPVAAKSEKLPSSAVLTAEEGPGPDYLIGPLDQLRLFVWRNPELSTTVTVRPDGRITVPLIEDLPATGQTSSQLAKTIESKLSVYIQNPIVSVIVGTFGGPFAQQIRIVGAAARPAALPYRSNMTLLDAIIAVGGLTEFAAGNKARLVRVDKATGKQHDYRLKISSLIKDGKISANVKLEPGDVIIIPESFF